LNYKKTFSKYPERNHPKKWNLGYPNGRLVELAGGTHNMSFFLEVSGKEMILWSDDLLQRSVRYKQ
jgi:hypothetical protein